jgi:hypothetical protein
MPGTHLTNTRIIMDRGIIGEWGRLFGAVDLRMRDTRACLR